MRYAMAMVMVLALSAPRMSLGGDAPATRPATTQPATQPAATQPAAITSVLDLLRDLPEELRPHPKLGWRKPTDRFGDEKPVFARVAAWLQSTGKGKPFDATLKLTRAHVDRNQSWRANKGKWYLEFTLEGKTRHYGAVEITEYVIEAPLSMMLVFGDDTFARRADKLKPGQFVRVSGTIRELTVSPGGDTRAAVTILLRDYQVHSPVLDE